MRDIDEILYFRSDISPFLVHLTKNSNSSKSAKENLKIILKSNALKAGKSNVSLATFGIDYSEIKKEKNRKFFEAVCFTETPISEIHCLLDINNRDINLEPYGIIFVREKLEQKGVSPVIYLNNNNQDQSDVICDLCKLIEIAPDTAEKILPLISIFGYQLPPYSTRSNPMSNPDQIDFRWEREWRYPSALGDLKIEQESIFMGLCPEDEIDEFESSFNIKFIDPTKNVKRYATKLIQARQCKDIKYSVV